MYVPKPLAPGLKLMHQNITNPVAAKQSSRCLPRDFMS